MSLKALGGSALVLLVLHGVQVLPAEIEGEYRMYQVDRQTGEISEEQPVVVTLTISKSKDGEFSVVRTSETARTYWEASIAGQIRGAVEKGFHSEADELRNQKFEDFYKKSSEIATDVEVNGTNLSFSFNALPGVENDDVTAISMYGNGPWLAAYDVNLENGEIIGSFSNNIPPTTPRMVYGKLIEFALLESETKKTQIDEISSLDDPVSRSNEQDDFEGVYRVLSIDRLTQTSDNEGYTITLSISKNKDGTYSVVETVVRDQEYWDANIAKEINRAEELAETMTRVSLDLFDEDMVEEFVKSKHQETLGQINSRSYEDEIKSVATASNVRIDGSKISFFFPNKETPRESTNYLGEKAFGWTYEGLIQNREIKGAWSRGKSLPKLNGTFNGKLLDETSSESTGVD